MLGSEETVDFWKMVGRGRLADREHWEKGVEVQGEDKRLKEIASRWEIEMQRSEVTGMTLREQSHRVVHTELRLESTISVHIVTNWLKQRTRETAKPLLSLDCLSCLRSV